MQVRRAMTVPSPMSLLHVVPSYLPAERYGGPIHAVHGLCRALVGEGASVAVATTNVDGPYDSDVPLDGACLIDGIAVHYARSSVLRRTFFSPGLARNVRGLLQRCDVLHTHSVFLWPTWKAARLARAAGRPYLVSPRGMLVPELIRARSGLAKRVWITFFERSNLQGAAAIHVTSTQERDDLLRMALGPLSPIHVVPNGVDLPAAIPGLKRDPGRVLFLGRLSWKKRIDLLVRAMSHVPEHRLDIAGPDDEGIAPELLSLAAELGVAERVQWLGPLRGSEKAHALAHAGVLVLPSLSENFGNVIAEAMASGLPVITTPEVGAAEHVLRAGGGVVTAGDPEAIAKAIHALTGDPEHLASTGAAGRAYAQRTLSWPVVARQMLSLYDATRVAHARSRPLP